MESLRQYVSIDQEFQHISFMNSLEKLDRDSVMEIFDIVHMNYLVRGALFSKICSHCMKNGVDLPPLDELMRPSSI